MQKYLTAAEAWDTFRVPSAREKRKKIYREFRDMFPSGHDESLKSFIELLSTPGGRSQVLKTNGGRFSNHPDPSAHIHPDAFAFIAAYGVSYKPRFFLETTNN